MADDNRIERLARVRREPPPLRPVTLTERVELSPRMLRLMLEGDGLRELVVDQPAASIRLLVPTPGTDELVIPVWNGNEFLLADGSRPALRTFTPLRVDNDAGRLEIEVVRHPGGAVSGWAEAAAPGDPAAISGPGTGYDHPRTGAQLIVLADETALPAAIQVAETAPDGLSVHLHLEVIAADAQREVELPDRHTIEWHITEPGATPGGRLVETLRSIDHLGDDTHVWAAGEASAMQAIRTHLFDTLGLERKRATVRGYWEAVPLMSGSPQLELTGKWVRLRTTSSADRDRLIEIRRTDEVRRRWRGDDFAAEFAESLADDDVHQLTITDRDGHTVGMIQFAEHDDPDYRSASLDIFVDPASHRRGIGTNAIRTLLDHLFDARHHHRVTIDPAADNVAAIECYRRVGFQPVGVMRQYERQPNGTWADGLLMEMLESDRRPAGG